MFVLLKQHFKDKLQIACFRHKWEKTGTFSHKWNKVFIMLKTITAHWPVYPLVRIHESSKFRMCLVISFGVQLVCRTMQEQDLLCYSCFFFNDKWLKRPNEAGVITLYIYFNMLLGKRLSKCHFSLNKTLLALVIKFCLTSAHWLEGAVVGQPS